MQITRGELLMELKTVKTKLKAEKEAREQLEERIASGQPISAESAKVELKKEVKEEEKEDGEPGLPPPPPMGGPPPPKIAAPGSSLLHAIANAKLKSPVKEKETTVEDSKLAQNKNVANILAYAIIARRNDIKLTQDSDTESDEETWDE